MMIRSAALRAAVGPDLVHERLRMLAFIAKRRDGANLHDRLDSRRRPLCLRILRLGEHLTWIWLPNEAVERDDEHVFFPRYSIGDGPFHQLGIFS